MVLLCFDQTESTDTVYYIATTTDACNGISCQTLSQFAANVHSASITTLILLEGRHYLEQSLTNSNVDNFTIHTNSSAAVINCGGSWLM